MDKFDALRAIVGDAFVLTGDDMAPWAHDWTKQYSSTPLCVVRPANRDQVAAVLKWANENGVPIVPVSGNTGLSGGTWNNGAVMLSVDRMNRIRDIRPEARIAIVEAGVILSSLHDAAAEHGLVFPVTFGARGSAMLGGILATNAGGSNVLRYGNTRDLCLGLEVVLPNGDVMDIMSELHKDNSGYNLRNLMIGSEGTLGIITAAVLKLAPRPRAYATAMVAAPSLPDALKLLNRLQMETGGMVEAFEYMPRGYINDHLAKFPEARQPFDQAYDVNILVEVGSTIPRDCAVQADGSIPLVETLQTILAELFEEGAVLDAIVAQSEEQRREMWSRREAAAQLALGRQPFVINDIALPLDKIATFFDLVEPDLAKIDAGAATNTVSHLGDGNVHFSVFPTRNDPILKDQIMEMVEDHVRALGGSFSAEHGIGKSKLPSMARRKDPVAIATMKAIKAALDPNGIMNPCKLLP